MLKILLLLVLVFANLFSMSMAYTMSPSRQKAYVLAPFRQPDPFRNLIEFIGSSVSAIFTPFDASAQEHYTFHPTMEKWGRIREFRKKYNKNHWARRDLSDFVERLPTQADFENLPAVYLAGGLAQAMSPIKVIDLDGLNPAHPPFRAETRLSQMKRILKRDENYYK